MKNKLSRLIFFIKSVITDEDHVILMRRYRYHLKAWYHECMTSPYLPPHRNPPQPIHDIDYDNVSGGNAD